MNTDNVGSREACQKLVENGIVLETDCAWYQDVLDCAIEWLIWVKEK